jgi:hypothetical protein
MTMNMILAAGRRRARRSLRASFGAVRSLSPSALIAVTIAVILAGGSLADAATGGNFILGQANKEAATASLASSKGTPLSLRAPSGDAPLAVSGTKMVNNLNAQFTGGLTGAQLQSTGGDGFTALGTNAPVGMTAPVVVATTGPLPAGTYYVTATALLQVIAADKFGLCTITRASDPGLFVTDGGGDAGFVNAAESAAVSMSAGDSLQEQCQTGGNNGSIVIDSGILATRVLASSGTPAASTSHLSRHLLPSLARTPH